MTPPDPTHHLPPVLVAEAAAQLQVRCCRHGLLHTEVGQQEVVLHDVGLDLTELLQVPGGAVYRDVALDVPNPEGGKGQGSQTTTVGFVPIFTPRDGQRGYAGGNTFRMRTPDVNGGMIPGISVRKIVLGNHVPCYSIG